MPDNLGSNNPFRRREPSRFDQDTQPATANPFLDDNTSDPHYDASDAEDSDSNIDPVGLSTGTSSMSAPSRHMSMVGNSSMKAEERDPYQRAEGNYGGGVHFAEESGVDEEDVPKPTVFERVKSAVSEVADDRRLGAEWDDVELPRSTLESIENQVATDTEQESDFPGQRLRDSNPNSKQKRKPKKHVVLAGPQNHQDQPGQGTGTQPVPPRPPIARNESTYRERRKRDKHVITIHIEPPAKYAGFIYIFAEALLTFGWPSHRIEAQLWSLARVFQISACFCFTAPDVILVSIDYEEPHGDGVYTRLVTAQDGGTHLSRICAVHQIYRDVVHDEIFASTGTQLLYGLLNANSIYVWWAGWPLSFITSGLICGIAFGGSILDMCIAGALGILSRMISHHAQGSGLSAGGSEIFTATFVSFITRGLSSIRSRLFCYSAISSASLVSLLPGYLILQGALDIAVENASVGAPKIISGIFTSLYLGFGLTLGSDVFLFFDKGAQRKLVDALNAMIRVPQYQGAFKVNETEFGRKLEGTFQWFDPNKIPTGPVDEIQGCYRYPDWPWWRRPVPEWTLFFLVPIFAFCASVSSHQWFWNRQMIITIVIACAAFGVSRVCNDTMDLNGHPDYVSLIGSFSVGLLGNSYSRKFGGTAFAAMLPGILLLIPDGLSAAGGLSGQYGQPNQDEYTQSLTLARKTISVVLGILAGVYLSVAVVYLFGRKKNAALVTF